MDSYSPGATIAEDLDDLPVNRTHLAAVAVCALGFSFDLLEIGLGSVLAAVFSMPPASAPPLQLSLLLASVYLGAVVGAPLFGWLADRHGRRLALFVVMAWLALCSAGAAFSEGSAALTGWRLASGLALGAFPPLMIAYLTDLLPRRSRGALIMVTVALSTLGPVGGIMLVRAAGAVEPLGLAGWRWGFIAGGCGALLVALLYVLLPESPRWLANRGREVEARMALARLGGAGAGRLPRVAGAAAADGTVRAPASLRGWGRIASLYFLCAWATLAFPLLSGAVLVQKGFKLDDTLLYIALSGTGPLFGNLLSALVVDRLERRVSLALCTLALLACGTLFVASSTPGWLVAASLGFQLFASIQVSVLNLYGGEQFPTASRARAIAGAWAVNRIGGALAPFVLLPLLKGYGAAAMFSVLALSMLSLLLLLPRAPAAPPRRRIA